MKSFYKKLYLIFALSTVTPSLLCAQEERHSVRMLARAQEHAIVLRIAPGSPSLWQIGNQYGYIIERFTVTRGTKYLGNRERKLLTPAPMKPLPMAQWESISQNNTFAEIAAQAIYGETFELSSGFEQDIIQVYNKAKELESRFSFALFAADISQEVAQASGLYFHDTEVLKDERYLYRVYSAVPQSIMKTDTAFAYVTLDDYAPLPTVQEVKAEFADKMAMISWNTRYGRSFYSAYWVERSTDGKNFKSITELPYVNLSPSESGDAGIAYKLDSLEANDQTYYYRVVGLTPFGETGPPSEIVKGAGAPALASAPAIHAVEEAGVEARINWTFAETAEQAIKGFEIERSHHHDEGFKTISPLLSVTARTFSDPKPDATNYYRVKAVGKNGERSASFPTLYQLEDSIPPLPPVGVTGIIDTAGVVTLSWKSNTESDLYGYRVYRSNFATAEFSQVTHEPLDSTGFREQLPLQNLTRSIYYKIQAIDSRFNPSGYSAVVRLMKPDIVPPVAPVIKSWKANQDKISIAWTPSASQDVAKYELKIKTAVDSGMAALQFKTGSKLEHTYTNLPSGKYQISVTAIDSSNNQSVSKPLLVDVIGTAPKSIEGIRATADRTNRVVIITWKTTPPNAQKILVYRAEKDKSPTLLKSLPIDSNTWQDDRVSMNTAYAYYFKVIFTNGNESELTGPVKVSY